MCSGYYVIKLFSIASSCISIRKNEKWLKQRVPISKYIMMPHMMADYSLPFNEVSLDFIRYIREKREEGNMLSDVVGALNRWSFECKCFG